ncbi:hypothetical protein GOV05_01795 [Candidatus Woesearchaeota archaeon]|nr:hypothetical protein [Candidatus Woesearchaeota archaeon]
MVVEGLLGRLAKFQEKYPVPILLVALTIILLVYQPFSKRKAVFLFKTISFKKKN